MKLVGKLAILSLFFLVVESTFAQISWPPSGSVNGSKSKSHTNNKGNTVGAGAGAGKNWPGGSNTPKQPKKPSAGKAPKLSTQTLWTMKKRSMKINTLGAVTLIRTAKTPSTIKIEKTYQYEKKYCARYAQRQRCGSDGFRCGYTQQCSVGPTGQPFCRRGMPRSCCWVENDCIQYDFVKSINEKDLTLKFKKPYKLTGAETETFQLSEKVKKPGSKSVLFEIKAIDTMGPYKQERSKKIIGGAGNKITLTKMEVQRNFPGNDDPVDPKCNPKKDKKCVKSKGPKVPIYDEEL
jgi:hypothetical protein